ncbi:antibiotic biosynthesis monooxygenase family protein [Chromobacterium violaceum]|uniref:antibiotic biosynthesis monooxygenase family protein n=1 Tax=Chromobacterium violaceum TaxID=536 RepID=UPI001B33DF33|nr:hypothetical protein [Chromobacterium violaceum]MBP4045807.1 hypothetical protein [Chromobacterium violaceum]
MTVLDRPPAQACWAANLAGDGAAAELSRCALRLAESQPGCLGVTAEDRVTYWDSVEAIAAWRARVELLARQRLGRGADEAVSILVRQAGGAAA